MRPRQSLLDLFSSFLQFDHDRFQGWSADPRLRRSMERCLAQVTETADGYWALYWHRVWQTDWRAAQPVSSPMPSAPSKMQLAREHLTAYIQEPCYWVAQKTASNFSTIQYTLADLFQMTIAQVDKVLKGFNPQQGFSLKNYASVTLSNLIRESLRQRQEVDICTDWALLRKLSQKRLMEALQTVGLTAETITNYVQAWSCFKTLYVPKQATGSQKLTKPEPQVWQAMAQLYNQEQVGQPVNSENLEKWLTTCARAVRAYLYPSILSINTPKPGHDSGEFIDDLAETAQTESLLSDLITVEEVQQRQAQQRQITALLTETIQQLDPQSQLLIQLYYQNGLTQQQLADRLEMKQYTVSRRLTKARELLLKVLANWSQSTLHIAPSLDLLNHTSTALEEWLKTYYQHPDLAVNRECYSLD
jgi:RNA polymerase sigma factor (sigma-70 family)